MHVQRENRVGATTATSRSEVDGVGVVSVSAIASAIVTVNDGIDTTRDAIGEASGNGPTSRGVSRMRCGHDDATTHVNRPLRLRRPTSRRAVEQAMRANAPWQIG